MSTLEALGRERVRETERCSLLILGELLWRERPLTSFSGAPAPTAYDRSLWLQINPTLVASAALWAGRHHLTLVFLEEHTPLQADGLELIVKVYSCLEDSASVQGCSLAPSVSWQQRSQVSQHAGDHLRALAVCDGAGSVCGLTQACSHAGLYTAVARLASVGSAKAGTAEESSLLQARWQCAWRLGVWDDPPSESAFSSSLGFHESFFKALQSFRLGVKNKIASFTEAARSGLLPQVRSWRPETAAQLRLLSDLDRACLHSVEDLCSLWRPHSVERVGRADELLLAGRTALLQQLLPQPVACVVKKCLVDLLVARCRVGRELQLDSVCEKALQDACLLQEVPLECKAQVVMERTRVAVQGHQWLRARQLMRPLLQRLKDISDKEGRLAYSEGVIMEGEVLLSSRALLPQRVLENNFATAVAMLQPLALTGVAESRKAQMLLESASHQIADVSDRLYRDAHTFLSSDEVTARKSNINRNLQLAERFRSVASSTSDAKEKKALQRSVIIHQRNAELDKRSLEEREKEMHEYLALALRHYLHCLALSTSSDLPAYKMLSLWFQNYSVQGLNEMVAEEWPKIKSHQMVPLLYQLVARMSCHTSSFTSTLDAILKEVCRRHPHHGLPVVLAMANAHCDEIFKRSYSHSKRRLQEQPAQEDRVEGAKRLVETLKKDGRQLCEHLQELQSVWEAYLSLANWEYTAAARSQSGKLEMPRTQQLLSLPPCNHTAPLTLPIPVQPSGDYQHLPQLHSWSPTLMLVGGVNEPKRLSTRLNDGTEIYELLKGRDDLRQDAVLEQVFRVVNLLLQRDSSACRQRLRMRTYVVTPLSQATGLVQWCTNSKSLGELVVGDGTKRGRGLHQRYCPDNLAAKDCYMHVSKVASSGLEKKLETYEHVLSRFQPVLRYLFHELSASPAAWYERRQRYTRSLATSCAAGYIFGLGDRHPQNILIDMHTAEVIQIDLGVAFDMAKILPTPETIPFRMTQNLVDGLGVSGVEGGLRTGLETTLGLMRRQRQLLSTVVSVLRDDPLQQWQLTPRQMVLLQQIEKFDRQDGSLTPSLALPSLAPPPEENVSNSLADRCLKRVEQKLNGVEDGVAYSVSEQTTAILHQATDPTNLCQLFKGWQAYI
ncbi:Phosphatidylinositol 3-/4-kinase catalytic domain [Trinorchestia longiramus]|nr:Phosphatidylinositol 3-/4-kinase catalytic domain [Trinorchestia longiramus]